MDSQVRFLNRDIFSSLRMDMIEAKKDMFVFLSVLKFIKRRDLARRTKRILHAEKN